MVLEKVDGRKARKEKEHTKKGREERGDVLQGRKGTRDRGKKEKG